MPATLKSRLPGISAELQTRVSSEIKNGAEDIAEDARRNLLSGGHWITGELYDSIHVERVGPAEYKVVADARGPYKGRENNYPYAAIVEFGGEDTAAYPFMTPAEEKNRHEVAASVQSVLRSL